MAAAAACGPAAHVTRSGRRRLNGHRSSGVVPAPAGYFDKTRRERRFREEEQTTHELRARRSTVWTNAVEEQKVRIRIRTSPVDATAYERPLRWCRHRKEMYSTYIESTRALFSSRVKFTLCHIKYLDIYIED